MKPWAAARFAVAMAVSLPLATTACDGHLDFGVGAGSGGRAGGATCAGDAECGLPVLHCDLAGSRTCVACTGDGQCTTAGALRCDPTLHRCVSCVQPTDCAATQSCVAGRCVTRCVDNMLPACPAATSCHAGVCASCEDESDGTCSSLPETPLCFAAQGLCVGCRADLDCGAARPRCDPVNKTCVQCTSGADCPAAAPFCDPRTGSCSPG